MCYTSRRSDVLIVRGADAVLTQLGDTEAVRKARFKSIELPLAASDPMQLFINKVATTWTTYKDWKCWWQVRDRAIVTLSPMTSTRR